MKHLVAPSLLAADFTRLGEEVAWLNKSEADWLHLDIMDGRFVPNISFGIPVVKAIQSIAEKPLDVHLMIVEPEKYIEQFRRSGAYNITVHAEACIHLHSVIQLIKSTGACAGVALNPHTPVSVVENVLEDLDLVLIMTVNPGFGGQKFIYQTLHKIRRVREWIIERNTRALIQVDGGVGLHNAERILHEGTDVLVAGSSIFKSKDPPDTIKELKALGNKSLVV
jgi:ribulose-phosphate 3-epimerase